MGQCTKKGEGQCTKKGDSGGTVHKEGGGVGGTVHKEGGGGGHCAQKRVEGVGQKPVDNEQIIIPEKVWKSSLAFSFAPDRG